MDLAGGAPRTLSAAGGSYGIRWEADRIVFSLGDRIVAVPESGGELETHHDHRLAMAFGVLGTVVPGIAVADPGVVSKSWPGYWAARDRILGTT